MGNAASVPLPIPQLGGLGHGGSKLCGGGWEPRLSPSPSPLWLWTKRQGTGRQTWWSNPQWVWHTSVLEKQKCFYILKQLIYFNKSFFKRYIRVETKSPHNFCLYAHYSLAWGRLGARLRANLCIYKHMHTTFFLSPYDI